MKFTGIKAGIISAGLLLFFALSASNVSAQRFIIGYGLSVFTDLAIFDPEVPADQNEYSSGKSTEFSGLSLSAEMKYNIMEFNSDLALSVASSPSVGIMTIDNNTSTSFGNLRLPLYVQLDFGNLSTFESMKNMGVGIGFGYEYDIYGLIGDSDPISLGTPAARLGVRYFNRNNSAREIALKVGLPATGTVTKDITDYNSGETYTVSHDTKITAFQLSWILYFNY